MTEDQIKYMVNRFLGWTLPADFSPDAGISFQPNPNKHFMPVGTNLFTATQANQMVRYMLEGLPETNEASNESK